jgi:hypothetical protein
MAESAPTTIRWEAATRTVELVAARIPTVQVEPVFPGDRQEDRCVWLGLIEGSVSVPTAKAGRRHRDDKFEIPLYVRVAGVDDVNQTAADVAEIMAVIEDTLAESPKLGELAGVIASEIVSERGPHIEQGKFGVIGWADVIVAVHARLT